jgi:calcium-dependent protein kinase
MLVAVNYIHTKGIVHRDIKLENFLYAKKDGDILKLIDFGFSKSWDPNSKSMELQCGTLSYMAPEVLTHSYTSQCDMWSLGVIVFSLLMGYMPFSGSARHQATCIEQGKYTLRPEKWEALSEPAQNFLLSLLQVDPQKRLTAQEALEHQWIVLMKKKEQEIDDSVVDALREYGCASKLRRCCLVMMAWSLFHDERVQVANYYFALDANKDGHITRNELHKALQDKFGVDDEELQRMLNAMDSNKDGEIHYSDFLAAMVSTKIELEDGTLMTTFQKFDTDRTGYITVKNLRGIFGNKFDGVKVKQLMKDVTQQGQISYPEFEAYFHERPQSPTKKHPGKTVDESKQSPKWLSCLPCCSV